MISLTKPLALASALFFASPSGFAATASSSSPLVGRWSLDTSRMPMPAAQRPMSVEFSFSEANGGTWVTHVDIVYAPGNEVHSVSSALPDGSYAAIQDSPEADHVALQRPVPNVVVMALQKDGVLVSTRIYSVTPDGNHLVESVVYPGTDRQQAVRLNYFRRVR